MLNKLLELIRRYAMVQPGDQIVCALSGGADSVALLFGLYLLREKLQIQLSAAHFNHQLRGSESDDDEAFVRELCSRYDIPLYVGTAEVKPGKKGLEAAAREARYSFLRSLPGKIATAHTADDNAETLLLHLLRGTGLKGLGGITPAGEGLIRPMLLVTRREVEDFLQEYSLPCRQDSSNAGDAFLRNRLRHHVMPLLQAENPRLAENLSAAALGLRQEEDYLQQATPNAQELTVAQLRSLHPALRRRSLERFLKDQGVPEPERRHIELAEELVFSDNPSARADLPGGWLLQRSYDRLELTQTLPQPLEQLPVQCPGVTPLPQIGLQLRCQAAESIENTPNVFTVQTTGTVVVRCRRSGDELQRSGGTKSLKKLFIDQKIPAAQRLQLPVLADEAGILGVCGFGSDLRRRATTLPAWQFSFEKMD